MKLYQHLQVNSEFFYSNTLDVSKFDGYKKTKIKTKKYSQSDFDTMVESLIFDDKELYVYIKTKNSGEFLLSSIHSKTSKEDAINYLKLNSKNQTAYLFDNVDYFSYGRFAIAKDEKIERYLSFNSEAMENENVVEWIGKPHKWETETHTYYTKKKLEDFEMDFDSNTVCEMAEFYIPIINEDLQILDFVVFSKEEISYYKPQKTQKLSIKPEKVLKIYKILHKNRISSVGISLNVTNHTVIISNFILKVLSQNETVLPTDKILSSNKMEVLWTYIDNFKLKFFNSLVDVITDIENAKIKSLIEVRDNILKIDKKITNPRDYYIHIIMKSRKKYKLVLTSKQENHDIEHKLGSKLKLKTIDKILTLVGLSLKDKND